MALCPINYVNAGVGVEISNCTTQRVSMGWQLAEMRNKL